ncbi:MAG: Npun_F0494 family protein [Synechococcus sp.]
MNESPLLDARSLNRAREALCCLPFSRGFYDSVGTMPLASRQVAERSDWCRRPCEEDEVEDAFRWLIRLGVLRREVDGQGLTQRVRLTPMGRQILLDWPGELPMAGPVRRLRHGLRRHWPRL